MRSTWPHRKAARRGARGARSRLGLALKGVAASALALAGLVAFATAASAHNNVLESVTAVCDAPVTGAGGNGATLTWTLYNDWAESETGTYSTTQGSLSTTTLSIKASPTNHATPPAAANQSFNQTLSAPELAALTSSSTINVNWSATWSPDGFKGTGTLSTTLAALGLPSNCVPGKPPSTTKTQVSSSSVVLGASVTDTATVSGNATDGVPTGTVTFSECGPSSSEAVCSGGSTVGTPVTLSSTGTATSAPFTPSAVGTYCFAAVYAPGPNSPYQVSNDNVEAVEPNECVVVTSQPPNLTVTKSDVPSSGTPVAPGSTINYSIAIKNVGAGTGSGTVTDVVPSSLTVNTTPPPGCTVTGSDTCSVANPTGSTWTFTVVLAAGDTATATFSATVAATATGTITNTATITGGPCTTAAGCSSSVSNPVIASSPATVTPTTPTAATATAATTTSPTTSASTTSLAATGAQLSQEWLAGLASLVLGSGLVLLARWRRRVTAGPATKK